MEYDKNTIDKITGLHLDDRQQLLRWFGKMPEASQIAALRLQSDYLRQRRREFTGHHAEGVAACLVLALRAMKNIETAPTRRNVTLDQIEKTSTLRMQRIEAEKQTRSAPLRRLIELRHWEQIHKWRNEADPKSWRLIAKYIATHHKRKISHTTLRRVYLDVLQGKIDRGEI